MKFVVLFLVGLILNLSGSSMPNVVVFLSDDQGWGDLSHSGNKDLPGKYPGSLVTL